jgi:RNA-binding protein
MRLACSLNGCMTIVVMSGAAKQAAALSLYDWRRAALVGKHAPAYNPVMPLQLSSQEKARLKARAHSLEPVVRIGQAGVTPEVAAEVDRALTAHELIKVSIAGDDRDERRAVGDTLADRVDATPVHRVGKVLILWRPRPEEG